MSEVLVYLVKALMVFTAAIAATRLMGKSAIVQLTPFDLVAIVIVGTLIAEPLVQDSVVSSLTGAGLVVLLHVVVSRLALFGRINKVLLGEPAIVVRHGKIVVENLRKNSLSVAQLLAILRSSGYPYLEDIEFALLEPIGQVSVLPREGARPLSPDDLHMPASGRGLPLPVILDSLLQPVNLALTGRDEEWLNRELRGLGVKGLPPVLYAYIEIPDVLFVHLKDGTVRCNREGGDGSPAAGPAREPGENDAGSMPSRGKSDDEQVRSDDEQVRSDDKQVRSPGKADDGPAP